MFGESLLKVSLQNISHNPTWWTEKAALCSEIFAFCLWRLLSGPCCRLCFTGRRKRSIKTKERKAEEGGWCEGDIYFILSSLLQVLIFFWANWTHVCFAGKTAHAQRSQKILKKQLNWITWNKIMSWASVWLHLLAIATRIWRKSYGKKNNPQSLENVAEPGIQKEITSSSHFSHSSQFFLGKFSILWTSCSDLHQRRNKFRCWSLWKCNGVDANVEHFSRCVAMSGYISCRGHWSVTSFVWVRHTLAWA